MGLSRQLGELLRGEPLELMTWSPDSPLPVDPGAFVLQSAGFNVTADSPSYDTCLDFSRW